MNIAHEAVKSILPEQNAPNALVFFNWHDFLKLLQLLQKATAGSTWVYGFKMGLPYSPRSLRLLL